MLKIFQANELLLDLNYFLMTDRSLFQLLKYRRYVSTNCLEYIPLRILHNINTYIKNFLEILRQATEASTFTQYLKRYICFFLNIFRLKSEVLEENGR